MDQSKESETKEEAKAEEKTEATSAGGEAKKAPSEEPDYEDLSDADKIKRLEARIESLVELVEVQAQEANEVLEEWQDRYDDGASVSDDGDLVSRDGTSQELVSALELRIKDLEGQLKTQREESDASISEWKEKCAALESKLGKAPESSDAAQSSDSEAQKTPSTDEAAQQEKPSEDALEKAKAVASADDGGEDISDAEKIARLEARVADLVDIVEAQSKEAESIVAEWEESYQEIQAKAVAWEYKARLFEAGKTLDPIAEGTSKEDQIKELESRIKDLVDLIEVQAREANEVIEEWQERYEENRSVDGDDNEILHEQIASLNAKIKELQDQLDGKNPAVPVEDFDDVYEEDEDEEVPASEWKQRCKEMHARAADWESKANSFLTSLETTLRERRMQDSWHSATADLCVVEPEEKGDAAAEEKPGSPPKSVVSC